jgi:ribonuclease P/MRP protein subunit POP3
MAKDNTEAEVKATPKSLSMVILTHPQPSLSPSHAHIPTLLHLATLQSTPGQPAPNPTRLITLPTSNDARFASALHIPRVGAIGIYEGAPGAKALEDYVKQHVGLTECPWIDEAIRPEWRGMNVKQS